MGTTDARPIDPVDRDEPVGLVVVGAGTAGIVAARTAVRLGARVLLVAADDPGGDCLWTGCVPSKALIAAASAARRVSTPGISAPAHLSRSDGSMRVEVDFAAVMRHVHGSIAAIAPSDSVESLEASGIQVVRGVARFTGDRTLEITGRIVVFERAIICTGAGPRPFQNALTTDTFWQLEARPERLLVIGGGPVGCEIAQAMARLGCVVTLAQRGTRLLPGEDSRASDVVRDSLSAEGVRVLLDHDVVGLDLIATVRDVQTGATERIPFDRALAATGRVARTGGLGLALAGVEVDASGNISTDASLRTTNPRIWAAGDVTALPRYTHTASANAELAVTNALTGSADVIDPVVARVTYTSPEVASVGERTDAVVPTSVPPVSASVVRRVLTFDHADLDRAIIDGDIRGFTSIVVDDAGVVRGATIVGPRAGDTLGELALAVRLGLTTEQLARTTHAYPGYGYAVRKLALQDVRVRAGRV